MTKNSDEHSASGPGSGRLEEMTTSEVEEFHPEVVVIPLGSTEPHGPHLPHGTDSIIADHITAEAVRLANLQGGRVLRLPVLPYGNNVNFKKLPFACRIRVETLMAVLSDLVTFVMEEKVWKIVICNLHGGNDATIKASLRQIHDRHAGEVFVCACNPTSFAGDLYGKLFSDGSPHAGDFETSMVQHFEPGLVNDAARKPKPMNSPVLSSLGGKAVDWVRPWHSLMPEACGGSPDQATAEKGREYAEASSQGLARFLVELSGEPWHPAFPFPKER